MTFLQSSTINRKSFRHRKVDNKKPLRIYTPGEINEDDCIPVSRAGIEIETGVEKEEEEEWHLVNALKLRTESMEKGATASGKATIPVPTSSRRISYYADVYQKHKWKKPSTYVKFSLPVEECIGCLYCMDERDDIWLVEHKKNQSSSLTEDQFEEIMQHFENVAKNKPQLLAKKQFPSWQDCESCLPESLHDLRSEVEAVYPHWKTRRSERTRQYQKAGPLMFEIKTQEGKDEEENPWTCFRRRELKPIRRTRRTETASFDKLRKIRKDIHSGRHIMVNVTIREKTKKQKIELDRKIFEKECIARELRKKLGIRNEASHDQPKRSRKSSFAMDFLGPAKLKSIKLSKKDDEYPMTDMTDYPYLSQRKPLAASYFRKFDSLKPSDRSSISCTAFRSRFGRGGRRRRIIDRLDVFSYRRIRETNERYKYDSDGLEDIFSDDEINQLDEEEEEEDDFTENIIRFHLFKEEDYQNLGIYRRIQKEKQNSPTKQQSLDALTGNNIPAQNPQHTPLANAESRQTIEQRTIADQRFAGSLSRSTESRTTVNQGQKLESDPRINMVQKSNGIDTRTNINNVGTYIDPSRTFNGVKSANAETITAQRLNNDSRTGQRVANNVNNNITHNGLILRTTVNQMNHHSPYKRTMQKNPRIPDDSNNNTIGGVTNVVATPNGMTSASLSSNTSITNLAKNLVTAQNTSVSQMNSPAVRLSSSNNSNTNGQGNGDGLARTPSNPGIIADTAGRIDPTKVGHAKILMNSGQMIGPSVLTQLADSGLQQILNLRKTTSTNNVAQQNNLRQSIVQTTRQQNITVPSVGSNVPSNSAVNQNIVGMIQTPSTSVIRQNNIVQSSGTSGSAKPVISQNFTLANGFGISPTSGSNTINVNPNVQIGTNGSQQAFVHPNSIVNLNNMANIIPTNGQSRATNVPGRFILGNNVVLNNVGLRQNVLSVPNGAARQVSTNNTVRHFQNGLVSANVFANNGNFGPTNLTQMRPTTQNIISRQSLINGAMLGNQLLQNYELLQSPRQSNVSPAVSTSNGGNSSVGAVGAPSPQPQAERTVR